MAEFLTVFSRHPYKITKSYSERFILGIRGGKAVVNLLILYSWLFLPQRLEMTEHNTSSVSNAAVSAQEQHIDETEHDQSLNTTIRLK